MTAAPAQPETPAVADCRQVRLTPGRRLRTRVAGIFLFLPLLGRLGFDGLVRRAGYPGSRQVPAVSALLSLLALKGGVPLRGTGKNGPWARHLH